MGKYVVDLTDIEKYWAITCDEHDYLKSRRPHLRYELGIALRFYKAIGRFPTARDTIPVNAQKYVADQLSLTPENISSKVDRNTQRRNSALKIFLGLRPFDQCAKDALQDWLDQSPLSHELSDTELGHGIRLWCVHNQIVTPNNKTVHRYCIASRSKYSEAEFVRIFDQVNQAARDQLLLSLKDDEGTTGLISIRDTTGKSSKSTFMKLAGRIRFISDMNLPLEYVQALHPDWRKDIYRKVAKLNPWEIRRFNEARQIGFYVVYLADRLPEMIDRLVKTFADTIRGLRNKAEREVRVRIGREAHDIFSREALLRNILSEALQNPERSVGETVFSMISKSQAEAIIGPEKPRLDWGMQTIDTIMSRWKNIYRRLLKVLLQTVVFKAGNSQAEPLINALDWIHVNFDIRASALLARSGIPIQGVISKKYKSTVINTNDVVDRNAYELVTAISLCDRLVWREIWVEGSELYPDPDKDVPADFDENRQIYYSQLNLSQSAESFIEQLKSDLETALVGFSNSLPSNPKVRLDLTGKKAKLVITPIEAQPEPKRLRYLKAELQRCWPMVSLLDILKEAALDAGFLNLFKTVGGHKRLDEPTLFRRLILCLYALGTNTGLKRIAGAADNVTYDQLLHVYRRFIDADTLRAANRMLANAILSVRDPRLWGDAGTACAADSQKYNVWDRNPISETHIRYGGKGLMAYWLVEQKSAAIYSFIKRVSDPESASMIRGILNHCTDKEVRRICVDSHGQTEVAFAFSWLLGFDLAPRIKRIAHSRLYLPDIALRHNLDAILPVLSNRPINWQMFSEQYDEMVKYSSALQNRTTDPETLLRRFTCAGTLHPTYKALAELGRVVKTIFVCRYLGSEVMRREINEGLNVIENWNSATQFVHFGRGGEISSNQREDQEVAIQALHLLQNSMVYVNTRLFQSVVASSNWHDSLQPEDYRGITPLIYSHITPYGRFELDLAERLSV